MQKNIRIPIDLSNDKNVTFNLEQDFDNLNVLSLNITSSDVYSRSCSDYGVSVGRVTINGGFGVQNAKVSIFVPIDPDDKQRPEILELYPFETVNDQYPTGVRYNLLPRIKQKNKDHIPMGTFPDVTDLTHYPIYLEVFEKYYKYTTVTNEAGDYMIYGIPLGPQNVHMDLDLLDTPSFAITANDLVNNLPFGSELSNIDQDDPDPERVPGFIYKGNKIYEIAPNTNLNAMPNIMSEDREINVIPFWGDAEECQLGITRCDFNLDYNYVPNAIFVGTVLSGDRGHKITTTYNPPSAYPYSSITNCKALKVVAWYNGPNGFQYYDTFDSIEMKQDADEKDLFGVFRIYLPMYNDYYVTNEFGDIIPSDESGIGIPTTGKYAFELFETDDHWNGRVEYQGGYDRDVLPGFRIPTRPLGDQWGAGWDKLDTNNSTFEYDILNKQQKYYTFSTTYKKTDAADISITGNRIPWLPTSVNSGFPLGINETYDLEADTTVIGSAIIPRVEFKITSDIPDEVDETTKLTMEGPRNLIKTAWTNQTLNATVMTQEWLLGVGVKANGIQNGSPISDLYRYDANDSDYWYDKQYKEYSDNKTWNYGENSIDGIPNTENNFQIYLQSKQPGGSSANDQGVFPMFATGTINENSTSGPFINSTILNGGIGLLSNQIVDITDDIPELLKERLYTSSIYDDNKYNDKYYFFGKTFNTSALRAINDVYNG